MPLNPYPLAIAQILWHNDFIAKTFFKQRDANNKYPPNGPHSPDIFAAPIEHVAAKAAHFGTRLDFHKEDQISKMWRVPVTIVWSTMAQNWPFIVSQKKNSHFTSIVLQRTECVTPTCLHRTFYVFGGTHFHGLDLGRSGLEDRLVSEFWILTSGACKSV